MDKKIINFDMAFSYQMIKERNLYSSLLSRNLDNYFSKVISVHPLAGLFNDESSRYGYPDIIKISDDHLLIEGKVGFTRWIKWIPPINFLLGQVVLVSKLITISKKENISVIKIGDPYYLGIIGLILKFFLKIPLVIRVCSNYDDVYAKSKKAAMPRLFKFRSIEKVIERIVFKRCDLIAGANENNMNYGINNGAPQEKCTVFRYGNLLDPLHWEDPKQRPDASLEIEKLGLSGKKFISTVARLEAAKYIEHYIYTIDELRNRNHDIFGLIIGDGSLRKEFEDLAASRGLSDFIKFAGNCKQDWIAKVIPHSALILSPHMGRALTEAALSNVPIVGYDHDWQGEVLINNKTGFLVKHEDWMAMSDRSEELLKDNKKSMQLAENAREHIFNIMSPEMLNAHEKSQYDLIIKKS